MASGRKAAARRSRRGFSLAGLLLVALGVLLLLNAAGVVSVDIWFELIRYWPMLLVIIGVKMLIAPRAPLIGIGAVCLILAATFLAASLTMSTRRADDLVATTHATPLEDTRALRLGVGFTNGSVALRSDMSGVSDSPRLFAADFAGNPVSVVQETSDGSSEIYLSTRALSDGGVYDGIMSFFTTAMADWELMVSPDVAVDIEIRAGAADLDLDLSNLDVERLVIGAGASDIKVWLPAHARYTRVEIAAGAADIEIVVPDGVAARIENDTFLSSTRIDSARFPETERGNESRDYSTSQNRVDIEIEAFAADITIG